MKTDNLTIDDINSVIQDAENEAPNLFKTVSDPIVSSDVIGMTQSVVFDQMGTLKINNNMFKTLSWYDNGFNQALRVLDLIEAYERIES